MTVKPALLELVDEQDGEVCSLVVDDEHQSGHGFGFLFWATRGYAYATSQRGAEFSFIVSQFCPVVSESVRLSSEVSGRMKRFFLRILHGLQVFYGVGSGDL